MQYFSKVRILSQINNNIEIENLNKRNELDQVQSNSMNANFVQDLNDQIESLIDEDSKLILSTQDTMG